LSEPGLVPAAQRTPWLAFAALAALFVVARARGQLVELLDSDEAIFHGIAERLAAGERLYLDVFDLKPPGIFLFYGAVRALAGPGLFAVHALSSFVVLAVAWLVARAGSALSREPGVGVFAAGVFLAFHGVGDAGSGAASSTEQLASLPVSVAMVLLFAGDGRSWLRAAGAGIAIGCALLCKPQAAAVILAAGYMLLAAPGRARVCALRVVLLLASAALPALLAYLYFESQGAGDAFWRWSVVEGVRYATGPAADASREVHNFLAFLALHAVPLLLAVRSRAFAADEAARDANARLRRTAVVRAAWIWFLAALAATAAGGRFYWNYFVLVSPPLAILAGVGAARAARLIRGRGWRAVAWLVLLLPTLGSQAWLFVAESRGAGSMTAGHRELAANARARLKPGERCFAFGSAAPIYYAARELGVEQFLITDYLFGFVHPTLLARPGDIDTFLREDRLAELARILEDPRVRVVVDAPFGAWRGHSVERVDPVMRLIRRAGFRKVYSAPAGGVWEKGGTGLALRDATQKSY
jgi:hypothetical protein